MAAEALSLSHRQREVLTALAVPLTRAQAAESLGLHWRTFTEHFDRAHDKLLPNARRRDWRAAVRRARELGEIG